MSKCNGCSTLAHGFLAKRTAQDTHILRQKHLPSSLYILLAHEMEMDATSSHAIIAPRAFTWDDLTSVQLASHISPQSMLAHTYPFLSAHSDPSRALGSLPLDSRWTAHPKMMNVVKIDTGELVPALAHTQSDEKIPVWVEKSSLTQLFGDVLSMTEIAYEAFESSCWICVDEVRDMLDMDLDPLAKGEWVACGYVPSRMICQGRDAERSHLETGKAKRISRVGNKAWTVEMCVIPERKSSLPRPKTLKRKNAMATTKQDSSIRQPAEVPQTDKPTQLQSGAKTRQSEPSVCIQSIHPPQHPPHLPKYSPSYIPSIAEVLNTPQPPSFNKPSNPKTTPTIIPPPALLLYSPIPITSPQSTSSAATLAKLEDVRLNKAALKMWIEESREKYEARVDSRS